MDLGSLGCSVQQNCGFRFTYTLHMRYKHVEWYMEKSFSDFEQLQESLVYHEFPDIPLLPDIHVSGGFDPLSDLHNAGPVLESFIQEVLRRPDTRSCIDVLTFCDLLRRLPEQPEPVYAELVTKTPGCQLSVSDVRYLREDRLMIVSYEEKSALSKIGRMWSIIEPDTLGAVRVYQLGEEIGDTPIQLLEKLFYSKVRSIEYLRDSTTLLVAKDDGRVELFRLSPDATEFEPVDNVPLHSAPILSMSVLNGVGFTSGYEDNIRAFEIGSRKAFSGGKLTKRLNGDKLLTSTAIAPRTMLLGTSGNRIYTYYMLNERPLYVDTCSVPPPMSIRKIHCTGNNVLVAHGNCVSCFGYSRYPLEKLREQAAAAAAAAAQSSGAGTEMTGVASKASRRSNESTSDPSNSASKDASKESDAPQEDGGTVAFPMSIRSAQFSVPTPDSSFYTYQAYDVALRPSAKQLLVAYDEVVAIWCIVKGVMLFSWYAHHNAVHVLRLLEPEGLVLTGGSDGEVCIWRLPDASRLTLWNPTPAAQ